MYCSISFFNSSKVVPALIEASSLRWPSNDSWGALSQHFPHVKQLFEYGSAIRKIMYTTNAVESIHSSFRKVTKKGAFPNENALLKVLYLRIKELEAKWDGGHIRN